MDENLKYIHQLGRGQGAADFALYLMKDLNTQEAIELNNKLREFLEENGL
jgi:hypothetical protein